MRAAVSVPDAQPRELVWGSFNALDYVPRMHSAAYPVLLHLLANQEPGGRCVCTHEELSEALGINRTLITRGMQHLGFASLIFRIKQGVYRLNPMIAGFRTPAEQLVAIKEMPREDRLDVPDFEERYQRRIREHDEEKKRRARGRKAPVTDLTARRHSLKAVED
ncbi:hypothetical protein [Streptomyces sp. 8N706]|uniref:hypothetical protein n=1 Tax=Streptomyces sp. 8N706 TaxID=3457416 RepID=UPI003FD18C2F